MSNAISEAAVPRVDMNSPRTASPKAGRLIPIDWMRGLVMVLMAIDHSSEAFNAGRLFTDSFFFYTPGTPLPAAQFLTRWITHLCAPTFVFLAGTGLAFTVLRKIEKGEAATSIDRYIAVRGLIIAAFELWISWFVVPPNTWLLQVLYAIGVCYLFMVVLRRLPGPVLLGLAGLLILGGEALVGISVGDDPAHAPLALALLVIGGERAPVIIGYAPIHWLPMMLLGFVWGKKLATGALSVERIRNGLLALGAVLLASFGIVRGWNGYGNMLLYREDASLVQWLHVSKYPPSISYTTLELGVMAIVMAALFEMARRREPDKEGLLITLGQTPMFFYLLHFPLLVLASHAGGVHHQLGLAATYAGALATVSLLYPVCRWYRQYKATGKHAWTQYI